MTNKDLEQFVDTSDEWIAERTGIRERRVAAKGQATSDLGAGAATYKDRFATGALLVAEGRIGAFPPLDAVAQ